MNKYRQMAERYAKIIHGVDVSRSVAKLLEKQLDNSNEEVYRTLLSCIDLTLLNFEDNDETIQNLVNRVNHFGSERMDLPNVAGVCVFPNFIQTLHNGLDDESIARVAVAGGFPFSQTFIEVKVAEIALALMEGADEIDVVLPLGSFRSGAYEVVCDELEELKSACRESLMKVILETGAMNNEHEIMVAASLALYSGSDFLKTSTGKIGVGATPEALYLLCLAVKQYATEHHRKVGIKVSGGVSTVEQAVRYYTIVKEVLGEEWLNNKLFRIGTTRLIDPLVEAVTNGMRTMY